MGYLNGFTFNAKLNPVIAPLLPESSGASSQGMSYAQQMSAAQKAEDDMTINGINLKTDIFGLPGQQYAQQNLVYNTQMKIAKIKQAAMEQLDGMENDADRERVLANATAMITNVKRESLIPLRYADVLKKDTELYIEDVKAATKYGPQSPAMKADIGSILSDTTKYGDYTGRTYSLARMASDGFFYKNGGSYATKGEYLQYSRERADVDNNGVPVSYADNRYIMPADPSEYTTKVKTLMNSVSGSTTSDKVTIVADGLPLDMTGSAYGDIVTGGAGYVQKAFSDNLTQLRAAEQNMFNKLTPAEKNYTIERLISSGAMANQIKLSNGKKIDSMPYDKILLEMENTGKAYENLSPIEREKAKGLEMQEKLMNLSREFINGVQHQVMADALGYEQESRVTSSRTSLTRSSAAREQQLKITNEEKVFNANYIESLAVQQAKDINHPRVGRTVFVPSGDGRMYAKEMHVYSVELPSATQTTGYMNRLYDFSFNGKTVDPSQKTLGTLPVQGVMMGGHFFRPNETPGLTNATYLGATSEVMVGPAINNGVLDDSRPSQTWMAVRYSISPNDQKNLMIPRTINTGKITVYSGSTPIDTLNGVSVSTGEMRSLRDFENANIDPFSKVTTGRPSDVKEGYDSNGNMIVKVWVPYDKNAKAGAATLGNTQELGAIVNQTSIYERQEEWRQKNMKPITTKTTVGSIPDWNPFSKETPGENLYSGSFGH